MIAYLHTLSDLLLPSDADLILANKTLFSFCSSLQTFHNTSADIAKNANKFFIVQLLESDAGGKFISWTRWGRVGEPGQSMLIYDGGVKEVWGKK